MKQILFSIPSVNNIVAAECILEKLLVSIMLTKTLTETSRQFAAQI